MCPLLAGAPGQEPFLDLLSTIVSELELRVPEPRTHTLDGSWALSVSAGPAAVLLVRHGQCSAWPAIGRHSIALGRGSALLLSGALDCTLQAPGPRRASLEAFDWHGGSSLEQVSLPPGGGGVQLVSSRVDLAARAGLLHRLPPVVVIAPQQRLPDFRDSVAESLIAETSHPRPGATAIVQRLLEAFIIRGLRAELREGRWSAPGPLGLLGDPVLRTGLEDARAASLPRSVETLASEVHRSARRVRARVRAISGESPGRLLRKNRMQRALQRLERAVPRLDDIARELGYATVSSFCRAFRREVGCTPGEYWRRVTGHPLPRTGRSELRPRPTTTPGERP